MPEEKSLAEQVKEDYQSMMLGLVTMRDAVNAMHSQMNEGIKRTEGGLQSLNKTVLNILHNQDGMETEMQTLETKVEDIEQTLEELKGLKLRVEALERKQPPAA